MKKSEVHFPLFALEMNCFTSWLKEWAILHVSLQGSKNEAYLSEVRFTTRPVIPMDMDGLRWIPMDPIGFHSTNRYRWIPSDNISALYDFHLTSGTLSRQSYQYFRWRVLRI